MLPLPSFPSGSIILNYSKDCHWYWLLALGIKWFAEDEKDYVSNILETKLQFAVAVSVRRKIQCCD